MNKTGYSTGLFSDWLVGKIFSNLTVLRFNSKDKHGLNIWLCKCGCGKLISVRGNALKSGKKRSCGCLNGRHGLSGTTEYSAWKGIITRCRWEKYYQWKNYGGRGIRVCKRWSRFENFIADMGFKPGAEYSIDRIDVNGDYEPSNCRWATHKQQAQNRRNNIFIELGGDKKTVAEWSDLYGVKAATVYARFHNNSASGISLFSKPWNSKSS